MMRALQVKKRGSKAVVDLPLPEIRDGYLLVRIVCVALNPLDAKNVYDFDAPNTVLGTDYSGIVERTGQGYTKDWKVGDGIFGFIHGGNTSRPDDGAFAEYAVVKADVQLHIPEHMSFASAASLGVALGTAAMGMCHKLRMSVDSDSDATNADDSARYVLIYGGSTSTGTLAIQLARLAGWIPITTCSPSNFPLVSSYGAEAALDYRDPRCASKICSIAGGKLPCAFDCISSKDSARICADSLSDSADAMYCSTLVLEDRFPKSKVKPKRLVLWTSLGESVRFLGYDIPPVPEDFDFLRRFVPVAEELIEDEELKCHPVVEVAGGLDAIPEGLRKLYEGQVSAAKLVYTIGSCDK